LKKAVILSLAIIMIVSFFMPIYAFAQNYESDFVFEWQGKTYKYRLLDNVSQLNERQINDRAVYRSLRYKKMRADELIEDGFTSKQTLCYIFPNINVIFEQAEKSINKKPQNASFKVKNGEVSYVTHTDGRSLDYDTLYEAIFNGKTKIEFPVYSIKADFTLAQAKAATTLRAKFSTSFASSGPNRSFNVAKALKAFDGLKLAKGERASFNFITGERTEKNGYKMSKIILNGEYVDGVGGGVCQVSSTLYNALLLSGMDVISRSRHTLVSGYVLAGFDAMVNSANADLIFENNTGADIYISSTSSWGRATFYIYGIENPYKIERKSVEITREPPQENIIYDTEKKYADKVFYDDESFVLTYGSDFVKAEAYLIYYKNDKEVKRKLLHSDTYSTAPRVVIKGTEKRPTENEDSNENATQNRNYIDELP